MAAVVSAYAPCADCGAETLSDEPGVPSEFYMVHNKVWRAAAAPRQGMLCVGCLEIRLGRQLCRSDFTDAMVNDLTIRNRRRWCWSWRSKRLLDRLTRETPREDVQLALPY
jgi:hypothetical protein